MGEVREFPGSTTERLLEIERQLRFIMTSTQIRMNVMSALVNAQGQQQATMIAAPMGAFYERAKAKGKTALTELTLEDFADEITNGSPCGGGGVPG